MKQLRSQYSTDDPTSFLPSLEPVIQSLEAQLLSHHSPNYSFLVAQYFAARIMKKMAHRRSENPDELGQRSAQILVFNSNRQEILLQQRGAYKRLFPNKLTVSANAKSLEGHSLPELLRGALKQETGLDIAASRFESCLLNSPRSGRLVSIEFIAFDQEEANRLEEVYTELQADINMGGFYVDYSPEKHALCIYSVDPQARAEDIEPTVRRVELLTQLPPLHRVDDHTQHSLFVVQLTEAEERGARERIASQSAISLLPSTTPFSSQQALLEIDQDRMRFVPWREFEAGFRERPWIFALDLILPHFRDDADWYELAPDVIDVDQPISKLISVAGGKGSNIHVLRRAMRDSVVPGLQVPETSVITTYCFARVVLGDPEIRLLIDQIEQCSDELQRKKLAAKLRERINNLPLPSNLVCQLEEAFRRLGGDVAIRSSATVEDLKDYAGAGQADTRLHVVTGTQLYVAVRDVWASLFLDSFISERFARNLQINAQMGVLLQRFIDSSAAGVVLSVDPESQRPVFAIEAQPGLGEGVVQGKGLMDLWKVGLRGDVILERQIREKKKRVVASFQGGTKEEAYESSAASMTDERVLTLARIAAGILRHYRKHDYAREIDVEFVLDRRQFLHIVQARSKRTLEAVESSKGKVVIRLKIVESGHVSDDTSRVKLSRDASVANPGAVVARLQVITADEHEGPNVAQPGCVIVTHHTNNAWNDVFAKLAGVITTDGGMTSHAAQNSQALRIPCVVGASGALRDLAEYDGKLVSLDADNKTVYLGEMSLIEIDRPLDVWARDAEEAENFMNTRETHEIFRPWHISKEKRPEVFIETFEGKWRRRSAGYALFQLDYYYKAWDRLTDYFNAKFAGRRAWELTTLHRAFKVEGSRERARVGLVQEVIVNDPNGIFEFVNGISNFSLDDAQSLFDDRWNGFLNFGRFIDSVHDITADNVEQLVDHTIDAFIWMHIGFWIDAITEQLFVEPQLQYVNPSLHNFLRNEAVKGIAHEDLIAPGRPDVPGGKVLYLSRSKDRSIYEVLERIRANPQAIRDCVQKAPEKIERSLSATDNTLLREVSSWSERFKRTSEDLRVLSDTSGYLKDIRERLLQGSTMSGELVAAFCLEHLDAHGPDHLSLDHIQKNDANLFCLLRGYARAAVCQLQIPEWNELSNHGRGLALCTVLPEHIDRTLPEALSHIKEIVEVHLQLRHNTAFMLDRFDNLRRTLALSKMQFMLREDGHHLIVPYQRKLSRMMLQLGKQKSNVLGEAENIFNVSTDEVVALAREDNPTYIVHTADRWQALQDAEFTLAEMWAKESTDALSTFSRATEQACQLLDWQSRQTQTNRTREAYLKEKERLRFRVTRLKERFAR